MKLLGSLGLLVCHPRWGGLDSYPGWGEGKIEPRMKAEWSCGRRKLSGQIDSESRVIPSVFLCICMRNFLWHLRKVIWIGWERNKGNCEKPSAKPDPGATSDLLDCALPLRLGSLQDQELAGRS